MPDHNSKRIFSAERRADTAAVHDFDASGVSNAEILHAINALRDEFGAAEGKHNAPGSSNGNESDATEVTDADTEAVQVEIARMVRTISHAKSEIAAIKHPLSEDDRINSASSQLDAIVQATESATQEILGASEKIEEGINKLGALYPEDEDAVEIIGEMARHVVSILEACNFQDITGQRISKVVTTIRFIEERVINMINIWGAEQFTGIPIPQEDVVSDDAALLNGPQLGGEGLQQSEIDALFD